MRQALIQFHVTQLTYRLLDTVAIEKWTRKNGQMSQSSTHTMQKKRQYIYSTDQQGF